MRLFRNDIGPQCARCLALMATVLLVGCTSDTADEGTPSGDAGIGGDAGATPSTVQVRYDLEAARGDEFFAFPYPHALRLTEDGRPETANFPNHSGRPLVEDVIAMVGEHTTGFSAAGGVYLSFTGSIDPSSLPQNPRATMADDATVYLIDLEPGSPRFGMRVPSNVQYHDEAGVYWPAHSLVIQPVFGIPLRPGSVYAAVITNGVVDTNGDPIAQAELVEQFFSDEVPFDANDPVPQDFWLLGRPIDEGGLGVRDGLLDSLRVDASTIVGLSVFRTNDPPGDLRRLRAWFLENGRAPNPGEVELFEEEEDFSIYHGTFDSEELLEGEAPYREAGSGALVIGENGAPSARNDVTLRFSIAVPNEPELPANGWPIVIYSHGTGGDWESYLSAADNLADEVAVIGIDQPLHGDRNPTSTGSLDLILQLTLSNILIGREMIRQSVIDNVQLVRMLQEGFEIPGDVSVHGKDLRFDTNRILFMGHSQGGLTGSLLLAVEPSIQSGVLSGAGGGAALSLLERKANDLDLKALVEEALGIDGVSEQLDRFHPAVGIIVQPLLDFADGLHFAAQFAFEPPSGTPPKDILLFEGLRDEQTPPVTTEALSTAARVPICGTPIEPVAAHGLVATHSEIPMDPVPISNDQPAAQNMPGRFGRTPTGCLTQFDGDHFIIFNQRTPQWYYRVFLLSAAAPEGIAFLAPLP